MLPSLLGTFLTLTQPYIALYCDCAEQIVDRVLAQTNGPISLNETANAVADVSRE